MQRGAAYLIQSHGGSYNEYKPLSQIPEGVNLFIFAEPGTVVNEDAFEILLQNVLFPYYGINCVRLQHKKLGNFTISHYGPGDNYPNLNISFENAHGRARQLKVYPPPAPSSYSNHDIMKRPNDFNPNTLRSRITSLSISNRDFRHKRRNHLKNFNNETRQTLLCLRRESEHRQIDPLEWFVDTCKKDNENYNTNIILYSCMPQKAFKRIKHIVDRGKERYNSIIKNNGYIMSDDKFVKLYKNCLDLEYPGYSAEVWRCELVTISGLLPLLLCLFPKSVQNYFNKELFDPDFEEPS